MERMEGVDAGYLYMETPSDAHAHAEDRARGAGATASTRRTSPRWCSSGCRTCPAFRRRVLSAPFGLNHPALDRRPADRPGAAHLRAPGARARAAWRAGGPDRRDRQHPAATRRTAVGAARHRADGVIGWGRTADRGRGEDAPRPRRRRCRERAAVPRDRRRARRSRVPGPRRSLEPTPSRVDPGCGWPCSTSLAQVLDLPGLLLHDGARRRRRAAPAARPRGVGASARSWTRRGPR